MNAKIYILIFILCYGAGRYLPEILSRDNITEPKNHDDVVIPEPEPEPENKNQSKYYTLQELKNLPSIEILARTLYGEGRSLGDREVTLIGFVIKNRVMAGWYANSYTEVCLDKYQFSCWNCLYNNKVNSNCKAVRKKVVDNQSQYQRMKEIAGKIIYGQMDNPIPKVYNYILKNNDIVIKNNKVESAYVSWAEGMEVIDEGEHIFLA